MGAGGHRDREHVFRQLQARSGDAAASAEPSPYSLDMLRSILETAPEFVMTVDAEGSLLYVNHIVPGLSASEVIGTSMYTFIAPEYRDIARKEVERVARTGTPGEYETASDIAGERRHFHTRLGPIVHEGAVVAITLVAHDITERMRIGAELERAEQKLRLAVDATQMGLWVWDKAEDSVTWDDVVCRHYAIAPEDAPATYDSYRKLIYEPDRDAVVASIGRCLATGVYDDVSHRVQLADGSFRWLLIRGAVVRDDRGEIVRLLGGVFDITERRHLDDQLRHAQKMEAVGELAAGVAHNFNNMLTAVLSNLELAARRAPSDLTPLLGDAIEASRRAADIVGQLVTFSGKRHVDQLQAGAPSLVVDRVAAMCRRTFDRCVELEVSCAQGLPSVCMNANHLEQALLNLCLNARDAMEDADVTQPRIVIAVDVVAVTSSEFASMPNAQPVPHVRIRVSDNGPGMDAATMSRVFEPFFTTKGASAGTGLGLATTYATVRDHGGWIDCQSPLGEGATFTIMLPRAPSRKAVIDEDTTPVAGTAAVGASTVLLVDDEDLLRRAVAGLLELEGHRVLQARDGAEALRAYKAEGDDIGVVLLDRSMPGMSGSKVLEQLAILDEHVRVILFTGDASANANHPAVKAVLTKPVLNDELVATIRMVLAD